MNTLEDIRSKYPQVTIVAVTKKRSLDKVNSVLGQGVTNIAENRLQELQEKYPQSYLNEFKEKGIKVHFIGHLQSNKTKKVVQRCDVIQSVDSLKLAKKISQTAQKIQKNMEIFLQLNLSAEPQKSGFPDDDKLSEVVEEVSKLPNVLLKGFMTMGVQDDHNATRSVFHRCKALSDHFHLPHVSMGMSGDYQIALDEGTTTLRLGRILFENLGNPSSQ